MDINKDKLMGKIKDFGKVVTNFFIKVRFLLAIFLDVVDFFIAWIPIMNSVWDIITFLFLMVTLRNKTLASISLMELIFVGIAPFRVYDAFIPIATILTVIDNLQTEVYIVKG